MNIFYIIQFFIYIVSAFLLMKDEDKYSGIYWVEVLFLIIYIISVFKKNKGSYIPKKESLNFILINILSFAIFCLLRVLNIITKQNDGTYAGAWAFIVLCVYFPVGNIITLFVFWISNLIKRIKAKKEREKQNS